MKYLRKFANPSAYQGATLYYPSVSLIDSTKELMWDKEKPEVPALRFSCNPNYSPEIRVRQINNNQVAYYSLDEGETWTLVTAEDGTDYRNISAQAGQSILLRGKILTPFTSENWWQAIWIDSYGCDVSGQLAAWINYEDLNAPLPPYCCAGLFDGHYDETGVNTNMGDASGIIFPETTSTGCYMQMFQQCDISVVPPILPATTLSYGCYDCMFYESGITSAPILPATTLANSCYSEMFQRCSYLTSVTMLATDISASNCLRDWLNIDYWEEPIHGVLYKNPLMSASSLQSTIPETWTIQDYSA